MKIYFPLLVDFTSFSCSVFSGKRDRSPRRAWLDNSTAACNFSAVIDAVNNQDPIPVSQDANLQNSCIAYTFVTAVHSGKLLVYLALDFLRTSN